jgi:hypothetical protein
MITRAYQNSKGERQEVSLTSEEWEALTEDQLQEMLGFKAAAPAKAEKPAKAAKVEEAPAAAEPEAKAE